MIKNESGLIEVEVDDKTYEFEKWGAEMSLTTLLKIAKIIGKPLGQLLGSVMGGGKGLDAELNPDMLADAVEALVSSMDEKVTLELIKKLSSDKVLCSGKKVNFDTHYEGKLTHLFKVVKVALEVQYGDFFGEILGIVQVQAPKAKTRIANHKG